MIGQTLFNGNIHGETLEYEPGVKIVQNWRFRNWAKGHFSKVTITFREPEPGNCFVDLVGGCVQVEESS